MIIASFNVKGGVGKTTTAVNLGAVLADTGRTVLVVDLEADMNASIWLGVRPYVRPSIVEMMLHECRPSEAVRALPSVPGLHLITGSPAIGDMDTSLRNVRQPERRLADVLKPLSNDFEFIVLDVPAGYSTVVHGATYAADEMILPTRADYLSLESLAHQLRWYRDRRAAKRANAHVTGILLTMVDHRRQATREIIDIIRVHNRHGVFKTEIPEDPRAAEAPSHALPLVHYARSKAATAYERFSSELLSRLRRRRR